MKYHLDPAHRAFFLEHGAITFQQLFTAEEAEQCAVDLNAADAADAALHPAWTPSRFRSRQETQETSDTSIALGRDAWRLSEKCKKWTMDRRCAEVAKQLTGVSPLRLLADQRYGGESWTALSRQEAQVKEPWTLEKYLCYQGIVCGVLICLRAPSEAPPSFFGVEPGMGTYFSPKTSLPIEQLLRGKDYLYLLIVYGKPISLFVHQPLDSHMQAIRNLGYHYGDRLQDGLHPIVVR